MLPRELRGSVLDAMQRRVLIADGAMGTELQRAGLAPGECGESWNLMKPSRVTTVQRAYVSAGAEILLTNTFGASRPMLERHGLAARTSAINWAGAVMARLAALEAAWVLGDIGPIGGFLEPAGDLSPLTVYAAFREQAEALVAGDVDGILVETMSAMDELRLALRAARDSGARVVVGSVAFESTRAGIRTLTGATPEEAAATMLEEGADVLGANCGTRLSAFDFAAIVRRYRAVAPGVPVMVQMNAGEPVLGDAEGNGAAVYTKTPSELAAALSILVDAGVSVVGGCCGTGPAHVRALAGAARHLTCGAA